MINSQNPDLVLWYPEAPVSGSTIYDYSGNGYNSTISGATLIKIPFNGKRALDFDGNDYTAVTTTRSINTATGITFFCGWVKFDVITRGATFEIRGGSTTTHFGYWDGSGGLRFYGGSTTAAANFGGLTTGVWYHFACWNTTSKGLKMVLNGDWANMVVGSFGTDVSASNVVLKLGNYVNNRYLNGQMSDFMMFDMGTTEPTEAFIKEIYNKTYRA